MNRALFLPFSLALLCATGCVETEQPPFRADDVVFEPSLIGNWMDDDKHERNGFPPALPTKPTHRIERLGKGGYRSYSLTDEKQKDDFTIFKLGDRYFITFTEEKRRYSVARLTISGNCLKVRRLHLDAVCVMYPTEVKHKSDIFSTVLIGSTDEVRAFLSKHTDDLGVWDRDYVVFRAADGLKVSPAGLTGRKQRTFDYWTELRLALQDPAIPISSPWFHVGALWSAAAGEMKSLSTDGVDQDAVACGALATEFCEAMYEYTAKRHVTPDPLSALVRVSTGEPAFDAATLPAGREKVAERAREVLSRIEATRKKLSERYRCDFPPIR